MFLLGWLIFGRWKDAQEIFPEVSIIYPLEYHSKFWKHTALGPTGGCAQDFTGFNAFGNTQMYLTPFMYDPSAPHGEENYLKKPGDGLKILGRGEVHRNTVTQQLHTQTRRAPTVVSLLWSGSNLRLLLVGGLVAFFLIFPFILGFDYHPN